MNMNTEFSTFGTFSTFSTSVVPSDPASLAEICDTMSSTEETLATATSTAAVAESAAATATTSDEDSLPESVPPSAPESVDSTLSPAATSTESPKLEFLRTFANRTSKVALDQEKSTFLGFATIQQVEAVPVLGKNRKPKLDLNGNQLIKNKKVTRLIPVYIPKDFQDNGLEICGNVFSGYVVSMLQKACGKKGFNVAFQVKDGQAINLFDVMTKFFELTSFSEFEQAISPWAPRVIASESLQETLEACEIGANVKPAYAEFVHGKLAGLLKKVMQATRVPEEDQAGIEKSLVFLIKYFDTKKMRGAKPQLKTFIKLETQLKHLEKVFATKLRALQYENEASPILDEDKLSAIAELPKKLATTTHLLCLSVKLKKALQKHEEAQKAKLNRVDAAEDAAGISDDDLVAMALA